VPQANLAEFGDLGPAEATLLEGTSNGAFDRIGAGELPAPGDESRRVRADLIRFLLLRGEGAPFLHQKGIRLGGAWIVGVLDLEGCRVPYDIGLRDCWFDATPVLLSAVVDTLSFDGSHLPGFAADRVEVRGDLLFRSTVINGPISLRGARVGGDLVFDGAAIEHSGKPAIGAERISVRGSVMLRETKVHGSVAVPGARIGGDLDLRGSTLFRPDGDVLEADSISVEGDIILRHAKATGASSLVTARIGGDVDLSSATLSNPGAMAFNLNRASASGALFLREGAKIDGTLSLNGAALGAMVDDPACWPAKGELRMNRCRYGALLGTGVNAETRLKWLALQTPERWGEDFWPQPYEQLAAVLGEMGHDEEKGRVLVAKDRLQRRARRARSNSFSARIGLRALHGLLWLTTGYGRMPLLAIVWMVLFWAIGAAFYTVLDRENAIRPNSPVVLRSPEWVLCGVPADTAVFLPSVGQERQGRAAPGQSQLECFREQPEASAYPKFNAAMLSADAVILGLGTGQKDYWSPDTRVPLGYAGKWYMYFQSLAGLALGLLAVAGFSGIVKSN
jgi:hypothetical protein